MQVLQELEKSLIESDERKYPKFGPGDTVRVHLKIVEGTKERIQVFQGNVIAVNHKMNRSTFVVRKISSGGYGVERILPLYCPSISKIEVVRYGRVRRSKLYYLRKRLGKAARIREKKKR